MNKLIGLLFTIAFFSSYGQEKQSLEIKRDTTEILILGTLHFNQFHNPNSVERDFSGKKRQQEFLEVITKLSKFEPDAVFIEREPKNQHKIDSLYNLENIDYNSLSNGMSEVYQIGFKLAKTNQLKTVYGVDYYESISQNLFEKGENIKVFKDSLQAFQNKGRSITKQFLKGDMSINDILKELNKKENIQMSHRLIFNTPAYVVNGTFKNEDNFNDIDNDYIGAEYISLFYERNLKIYSNILNLTERTKAKRIVLIIGQVHVGVLQQLIDINPNFKVVNANQYLGKNNE